MREDAFAIASDTGGALGAPPSIPRPARRAASDEQLRDRLRSIAESAASPEEALDPMVRAVIEAMGACAGAVCLFDTHERMLRLAAEAGLSDEGCRRLRNVREGEVDAWEMPLHGLVNGRAYLIENASRNRFVPPLIEDASAMNAVVCLPLCSSATPLASLILVALKPRTFYERRLHSVEGPLQEMARVIEATRRQAEERGRVSASTPSPTAANAGSAPRMGGHAAETTSLAATLANVEHERHQFTAATEIATLTGRVQTLTAAVDQLREAHAAAGATCDRLAADLRGSATAKAHLEEALQAALEEARTRGQEATEQLEETRAQVSITVARLTEAEQRLVALGEERVAEAGAFATRIETLESEAARWRAVAAAADTERDRLAPDLEGAAAAKAHLEETLKTALESARSRQQDTTALLQEVRGQVSATAVRLTETEVTLRAICEEVAARTQALTADAERMREAQSAATSERDHLAAELASARAAHDRLEQTLAQTLAESRDREEAMVAQLAELAREVETLRAEHPSGATKPAVETSASGKGDAEGAPGTPSRRPTCSTWCIRTSWWSISRWRATPASCCRNRQPANQRRS
jgi:chromosome segregation ATPase